MKILLLASAYNGMCQRVHRELVIDGHDVEIELSCRKEDMLRSVFRFRPELIVCPYLKYRIPDEIWRQFTCLIVHPGIEGDRGPSSLDWAITDESPAWGVTLLQANEEMDAGDIWGTSEFPMRNVGKASIYRREVIEAAVKLIKAAINDFADRGFRPRRLDYSSPRVKGRLRPLMNQEQRAIDWDRDGCADIVRKVNAADSFPGVADSIGSHEVLLFGAVSDTGIEHGRAPGDVVGYSHGAICRAAHDGAVWIRQMKPIDRDSPYPFKLPAEDLARHLLSDSDFWAGLPELNSRAYREIRVATKSGVAYVDFDFYNGAMNTDQCRRLKKCLEEVHARDDIRVVTLMGGSDFWSNGIHLNCIEAARDPARESWLNINAINDVVRQIITMEGKVTVAALRNNAGAGGAIMPMACDRVFIREGVVLNPHYRNMGLYGSEYWTYLLPRRVGRKMAQRLTRECAPLLASEALDIGVADTLASEDWRDYHQELQSYCENLARDRQFSKLVARKYQGLAKDERARPLEEFRQDELVRMKEIFDDPDSSYHSLRYQFVRKTPLPITDEAKSRALRTVKKQVRAETTRTNTSRPEVAYEASE